MNATSKPNHKPNEMKAVRRILLVDDDADDQFFFSTALAGIDHRIELLTAGNGQEGLELLRQTRPLPDLIFLDLNMPLMNGWEFLRQIKSDKGLRHIDVIIYSTSSYIKDKLDTSALGATDFVTKPDDIAGIRKAIEPYIPVRQQV